MEAVQQNSTSSNFKSVERFGYTALVGRSEDSFKEAIRSEIARWRDGTATRPDMHSEFYSVVEFALLTFPLKVKVGKRKRTEPKTGTLKASKLCRFGPTCKFLPNCKFGHEDNSSAPKKQVLSCGHCGKKGHVQDTCFTLHPNLKTEGKDKKWVKK
jgi:flavin-binding protein dodecin